MVKVGSDEEVLFPRERGNVLCVAPPPLKGDYASTSSVPMGFAPKMQLESVPFRGFMTLRICCAAWHSGSDSFTRIFKSHCHKTGSGFFALFVIAENAAKT
jgi:hypothetical protein